MLVQGFNPMLTLQCKILWWENISSGVQLRSDMPTERGELKAYILSVVGRRKGLVRRDLPRIRFALNHKNPCQKDHLRVLLIGPHVCGAKYVICADGIPTTEQILKTDKLLRECYSQDIRRAGRAHSIVELSI